MIAITAIPCIGITRDVLNEIEKKVKRRPNRETEHENYVPMSAPFVHEMTWSHLVVTKRASANIRLCRLHHHLMPLAPTTPSPKTTKTNSKRTLERRRGRKAKTTLMTKQNLYPP